MNRNIRSHFLICSAGFLVLASTFALAGCSGTSSAASTSQMPPPDVGGARVLQKDGPVYHEWIGTLNGKVNAAIKAQVTGYLQKQDYSEGSFVRKGQLLFQ